MRFVLQRVKYARVIVDKEVTGEISSGLLVLVGISRKDSEEIFKTAIMKIINMRIFSNEAGKFHHSVLDLRGEVLLVPQFTLFADTSHGRRPEFFGALEPKAASSLFSKFVEAFQSVSGLKVEIGVFGADMKVELLNDGPVTIIYDTEASS